MLIGHFSTEWEIWAVPLVPVVVVKEIYSSFAFMLACFKGNVTPLNRHAVMYRQTSNTWRTKSQNLKHRQAIWVINSFIAD